VEEHGMLSGFEIRRLQNLHEAYSEDMKSYAKGFWFSMALLAGAAAPVLYWGRNLEMSMFSLIETITLIMCQGAFGGLAIYFGLRFVGARTTLERIHDKFRELNAVAYLDLDVLDSE